MAVTVQGVLPDPMGNPIEKGIIRVTTIKSLVSPFGSEAEQKTSKTGEYNFTLEVGIYMIELNQSDEFTKDTYVEVTEELTGSITLAELLGEHEWTT